MNKPRCPECRMWTTMPIDHFCDGSHPGQGYQVHRCTNCQTEFKEWAKVRPKSKRQLAAEKGLDTIRRMLDE